MKMPRLWIGFGLLICTSTAAAHDTWLLASDYFIEPGETISLDMTSGMAFPAPDYAIKPERVSAAETRLAGQTQAIEPLRRGEHALQFKVTPKTPGVARIRVSLAPRPIELTPEDVAHYLEEIGAPEHVRQAWQNMPEPRAWHEMYTKHALAYVRVGKSLNEAFWGEPLGLPLEFVPQQDPTALAVGDTLVLQVLKSGRPYSGFSVGVVSENGEPLLQTSNDQGLVQVPITETGLYLVRGTDIEPPGGPEEKWRSQFMTMTFAVRGSSSPGES